MHGGAMALAEESFGAAEGLPPQVLFASDMLDIPVYLALAHPAVREAPVAVYFHENQLTYPLPPGVERDLGLGMKNLQSGLVADAVYFNSEFHMREFLSAAAELLALMPDAVPGGLPEAVASKATVLPVGCDLQGLDMHRASAGQRWGGDSDGPLILWNQRWEYDKAPGDLFRALYALQEEGVPFRLAMAGTGVGEPSALFVEAKKRLGSRLVQWGRLDSRRDYAELLWAADVVVSTAVHEFFGVAIVEAIYCGCRPVLPRRLSYPELVPAEVHEEVLYDGDALAPLLRRALTQGRPWSEDWQRTWVARFDWANMIHRYDAEIWACWERGVRRGQAHGASGRCS